MKRLLTAVMIMTAPVAFAAVDASEVGPKAKQTAKDVKDNAKENAQEWGKQAGLATEDQGTFKQDKAFDMRGKLKEAGPEEITVARVGLPDAALDLRDKTQVMIDGKKAKPSDLKQGADVRVKFQIEGKETVAVMVNAKSPSGSATGGAGEAGSTAQKAEDKMERGAQKAEQKTEKAGQEAKEAGQDAKDTANKASKDAQREMDTLKQNSQSK